MSTTTVRHPAHYHVTIRRTGRDVSVESMETGRLLVYRKCTTVEEAKECERNTIRTWRASATAWGTPTACADAPTAFSGTDTCVGPNIFEAGAARRHVERVVNTSQTFDSWTKPWPTPPAFAFGGYIAASADFFST